MKPPAAALSLVLTLALAALAPPAHAARKALFMCNDKYTHSDVWADLGCPPSDRDSASAYLAACGFDLTIKERRTRDQISADVVASMPGGADDVWMFLWSGHGENVGGTYSDGTTFQPGGQLVGKDDDGHATDLYPAENYFSTDISKPDATVPRTRICFIDGCGSGKFVKDARAYMSNTDNFNPPLTAILFAATTNGTETAYCKPTASDGSWFLTTVFRGLRGNADGCGSTDCGGAADGKITADELHWYLVRNYDKKVSGDAALVHTYLPGAQGGFVICSYTPTAVRRATWGAVKTIYR